MFYSFPCHQPPPSLAVWLSLYCCFLSDIRNGMPVCKVPRFYNTVIPNKIDAHSISTTTLPVTADQMYIASRMCSFAVSLAKLSFLSGAPC
jgi:hypothetical protein